MNFATWSYGEQMTVLEGGDHFQGIRMLVQETGKP
jgi:hypothetical protein